MSSNPFEVLSPVEEDGIDKRAARKPRRTAPVIVVIIANLPVPLFCACAVTRGAAILGLALAVAVLMVFATVVSRRSYKTGRYIALGGVLTALSQLMPLVQIFLGSIVLEALCGIGLATRTTGGVPLLSGCMGGFVATVLTGASLMMVAVVIGYVGATLFPTR